MMTNKTRKRCYKNGEKRRKKRSEYLKEGSQGVVEEGGGDLRDVDGDNCESIADADDAEEVVYQEEGVVGEGREEGLNEQDGHRQHDHVVMAFLVGSPPRHY